MEVETAPQATTTTATTATIEDATIAQKNHEAETKSIELYSSDYYFDSYTHFSIHEEMLKDSVRTCTYRDAIMVPGLMTGKVVLDVGCGTGILSLFASKAGAKHVYAIDCAGIIEQAREIAQTNGFGPDKVTFIRGKVEEIELPEKVDIIISEWMGYCLIFESMLASVIYARDKWLKPGGLILPNRCDLYLTAISDEEYKESKINWWGNVYGFDMSNIGEIAIREPLVDEVEAEMVATSSMMIKSYDIMSISKDDLALEETQFSLRGLRDNYVHAFCTYFNAVFDIPGAPRPLVLPTGPFNKQTHWKQTIMYIRDVIAIRESELINGTIKISYDKKNPRNLDIDIDYAFSGSECSSSASNHYIMN